MRNSQYAVGNYRVMHYPAESFAGVTIGEHYAVERLGRDRYWLPIRYWPTARDAHDHRAQLEARS